MALFIVKWSDNWADEMDLEGFNVFEAASPEEAIEAAADRFFDAYGGTKGEDECSIVFHVGTNEEIEYESRAALAEHMTAVETTPEEVAVIRRLFRVPYGFFPG